MGFGLYSIDRFSYFPTKWWRLAVLIWNEPLDLRSFCLSVSVCLSLPLWDSPSRERPRFRPWTILLAFSLEVPSIGSSVGLGWSFGLTLLHRCLCIETKNEHMVFVPVAHEQTLAMTRWKWHRLADLALCTLAGAEVRWDCRTRCLDIPV